MNHRIQKLPKKEKNSKKAKTNTKTKLEKKHACVLDIPKGAVLGNPELQVFCSWCHEPKHYYLDITKKCVQCSEEFVFYAKEQKYWYEVLKFNFHSDAIRCPSCRKSKRSEAAMQTHLTLCHEKYKLNPNDPYAMLAVVESTCSYYEKFQGMHLSKAITLTRKAYNTSPQCVEAFYWEAVIRKLMQQPLKAQTLFEKFIDKAQNLPRCKNLVRLAKMGLSP